MSESVAHEQVTEFVMDAGDRNVQCRQQQESKSDDRKKQSPNGEDSPFRKTRQGIFGAA